MAAWTDYTSRSVLLDVTATVMAAGGSIQSPTSGSSTISGNTIEVTPNSVLSTAVPQGYAWDALLVEITSPVQSAGVYPDCIVEIYNGTTLLSDFLYIDGSFGGNMFPRAKLTRGQRQIALGFSTKDLLAMAFAGRSIKNLPLKITGLKVTSGLTIRVTSVAGWTSAALVPLRVKIYGDVLTASDIDLLATAPYNGEIKQSVPGAPDFSAFHSLGGPLSLKTWGALPGGNAQNGGIKVNRRMTFAYNASPTVGGAQFIFSQNNAIQGANANVATPQNDLGDAFKGTGNFFAWDELGVNLYAAATVANFGLKVDGTVVPQDTSNGTPISSGYDNFAFGAVALNGQGPSTSSDYDGIPAASQLGKFASHDNGVVPFIVTTAAIAANEIEVVKGGVLVSQG